MVRYISCVPPKWFSSLLCTCVFVLIIYCIFNPGSCMFRRACNGCFAIKIVNQSTMSSTMLFYTYGFSIPSHMVSLINLLLGFDIFSECLIMFWFLKITFEWFKIKNVRLISFFFFFLFKIWQFWRYDQVNNLDDLFNGFIILYNFVDIVDYEQLHISKKKM